MYIFVLTSNYSGIMILSIGIKVGTFATTELCCDNRLSTLYGGCWGFTPETHLCQANFLKMNYIPTRLSITYQKILGVRLKFRAAFIWEYLHIIMRYRIHLLCYSQSWVVILHIKYCRQTKTFMLFIFPLRHHVVTQNGLDF